MAETRTTSLKSSLEDRFDHDLGRRLHHPVADGGDAQWPHTAMRFGDVHTPGGRGTIRTCAEILLQFSQHALNAVGLHLSQSHTINPGRALVGPDPLPRLHQDVTPIDAVIQGVETPLR